MKDAAIAADPPGDRSAGSAARQRAAAAAAVGQASAALSLKARALQQALGLTIPAAPQRPDGSRNGWHATRRCLALGGHGGPAGLPDPRRPASSAATTIDQAVPCHGPRCRAGYPGEPEGLSGSPPFWPLDGSPPHRHGQERAVAPSKKAWQPDARSRSRRNQLATVLMVTNAECTGAAGRALKAHRAAGAGFGGRAAGKASAGSGFAQAEGLRRPHPDNTGLTQPGWRFSRARIALASSGNLLKAAEQRSHSRLGMAG